MAQRNLTRSPRSIKTAGRRRRLIVVLVLVFAFIALGAKWGIGWVGVPPRLLAIYVEGRLDGHNPAIEAVGRQIGGALRWLDRGVPMPQSALPSWFGAQAAEAVAAGPSTIAVASPETLRDALAGAKPRDVILILPGAYSIDGPALQAVAGGGPDAPITVRARRLGDVTLEFDMLEGFRVAGAYWVFENLVIRGICQQHDDCEHAWHVVGGAQGIVIRNNDVRDFNAHIKINGENGQFPDSGRIVGNTLANSTARNTANPVTPVDLVGANDWTIADNLIADFVKAGGDATSYGAFAKGAGRGNQFTSNVVLCEHRLRGAPGRRVGLSFGGGGTSADACRDGRCDIEHEGGIVTANLIAGCSDAGIYINRSVAARLADNTLIDTAGVQVRSFEASATVEGNLIDGAMDAREGGIIRDSGNIVTGLTSLYLGYHPVRNLFENPAALDLRWRNPPARRSGTTSLSRDLCGAPRGPQPAYGALENFEACRNSRGFPPVNSQ